MRHDLNWGNKRAWVGVNRSAVSVRAVELGCFSWYEWGFWSSISANEHECFPWYNWICSSIPANEHECFSWSERNWSSSPTIEHECRSWAKRKWWSFDRRMKGKSTSLEVIQSRAEITGSRRDLLFASISSSDSAPSKMHVWTSLPSCFRQKHFISEY